MRLLLDLGNTRLKWALQSAHAGGWAGEGALEWQPDMAAALASAWAELPSPAQVVAASVVAGEREAQVAEAVQRRFTLEPRWLRTPAAACGVRNAYAEPQRLGVDRFLAMVAAHADGLAPCVLAGLGTALTLDALTGDGQHLGGLIAPGPRLMQQSLVGATARIRPERAGQILELADNTPDAVASGCWQATVALVERFHARMAPRLGGAPQLLLAGGDAVQLLPLLSLPARLSQDAVLRGVAVWADAQRPEPPPV